MMPALAPPAVRPRILVVEDNEAWAHLVVEVLSRATERFHVTHVACVADALAHLNHYSVDALLLDLSLPDSHELDGLAMIRGVVAHLPIIVLTALNDEDLAIRAVQRGAQDYLIKGQDIDIVARAVRYAIERRRAEERLAMAERLRAVGELAAEVSHHLNNVLAVIDARVQCLLDENHPDETRRSLDAVHRAAQYGAEVIRRLQQFSSGRPVDLTQRANLNQIAEEVIDLARPIWVDGARGREIWIGVKLETGDVPAVHCDPLPLRQAFMSLLLNAIEALPEGGTVTVRTWAAGGRACCAVVDTGVGMSADIRRRAFEPFFTTKGPKRTGLGLSLAYQIVERHGGTLTLESTEGQGSTVTLSLPLSD